MVSRPPLPKTEALGRKSNQIRENSKTASKLFIPLPKAMLHKFRREFSMKQLIFFILMFPVLLMGQSYSAPAEAKWDFGLMGGMGFNGISGGSSFVNYNGNSGLVIGPFLEYRFAEHLQLRLEINYEERSINNVSAAFGLREYDTSRYICHQCYYIFDVTYTNSYLTIPLIGQYTRSKGKLSIGTRIGVYYSILTSSWNEGFEELYIDPVGSKPFTLTNLRPGLFRIDYSGEAVNVINTYDSGLILGIFAKYALSNTLDLQVDGSLHLGFAGLFENPAAQMVNNRTYQVRLGFGYKAFR